MRNLLIILIRSYQLLISPLLPCACRFYPSCSEYSIQAFRQYGIKSGLFLTIKRVIRCNPFGVGGYDPVPELKANSEKSNFYPPRADFRGFQSFLRNQKPNG